MCASCSDRAVKLLKLLGDFRATADMSSDTLLARRLNDTADELLEIVRDMLEAAGAGADVVWADEDPAALVPER